MPSVIEAPVIEAEGLGAYTNETLQPVSTSHPSVKGRFTALISGLALRGRQRAYLERKSQGAPETLIDMLARQQPYIYIKAMAG